MHSENVEPSRPLQTYVQVKRKSDGYNVISGSSMASMSSDVTSLVTEKFFLDTNMPDMRLLLKL